MPGHKRNKEFMPPDLLRLDITEVPGMDVLFNATGILKEMQDNIAAFYKADSSFFLVNGSSSGVVAAVCYAHAQGKPLIIPRNAHVSVYNGLVLCGGLPQYIMPCFTPDGLAGGVCSSAFDDMPHGAAAFVVSPTYEGFVSDIAAIAQKVHARGGILIVDEAHGAHFTFHQNFPKSAMEDGADIVITSFHKTLPALSQTAALHVSHKRVDAERLKFFVNAMQTSSPSYMFMSAADYMLNMLWARPCFFENYVQRLNALRASLATTDGAIKLSGRERIGDNAIFDVDEGKLLFTTPTDAETISKTLAAGHKIQMEMAAGQHMLAMTSVADTDEGFARLKLAINELNKTLTASPHETPPPPYIMPEIVISPQEALRSPTKKIPWETAHGRISAQIITRYPPGIALVAPGERIPQDVCRFFSQGDYVRVVDV